MAMGRWVRCVSGVLLAFPLAVFAASLAIEAKITRTLTAGEDTAGEEKFGGCMVWLSVSPATEGLACNMGNWVTFSCTGEHVRKSSALRMFDSAQMAFMTDRRVWVTVDDTRKHNGWCLVERIDVLAN